MNVSGPDLVLLAVAGNVMSVFSGGLGVILSGLIVWKVAAAGMVSSFVGRMIGGRIAMKKGDGFVAVVMITLMALAGIWLIIG